MSTPPSSPGDMTRLFSLEGKVAVVTGSSRRLGREIARGMLSFGARVYLTARDASTLDEVVAELSPLGETSALPADLSTMEGVDCLVRKIAEREPHLDVLVNNAGAVWNAPLESFPEHGWDKVMQVNLRAPFFLTQRMLPVLRAGAQRAAPARIINVASTDALHVPITDTYSYTAAKAGLVMMTRMLAARLGKDQITANVIAPGAFPTRMTEKAFERLESAYLEKVPLGRFGTSADIAGAAVVLASAAGAYVNGAVLPVDGGWVGAL